MTAIAVTTLARLKRLEFLLLCILLMVLPILEAPKNIALALFILIRVARAFAEGSSSFRRPEPVEWAVWGLVLAAAASTVVNWPFANADKGLKDVLSYSIVFLIVYRERYTPMQKYLLIVMSAAGVMVGLIWGIVQIMQGKRAVLELHSVGVVTHSSIYLGVAVVMALGMALFAGDEMHDRDRDSRVRERRYWWVILSLFLLGIFAMASRAGLLSTGVALLLALLLIRRKELWLAMSLLVIACAAAVWALPNVFDQARILPKVTEMVVERKLHESDSIRISNWRVGFAQISQGGTLLFGVGPRNFAGIDLSKLRFDRPLDLPDNKLTHAHNLFLNKLVEEGIFGLAAMLTFFVFVASALFRDWRADRWNNWPWLACMGALVVPIVSGTFSTPWYNEHALLAMILFAVYLSSRNPQSLIAPGGRDG
ncbi:MAG TPA: O-antigen ligase family protein [Burkholderiales bacterium]|nr:O-antigen ligase family protein [Burkholderiales bacterium]